MLSSFPSLQEFKPLIDIARREDLGDPGDDVTSRLSIGEDVVGVGTLLQKETGVSCCLPLVEHICRAYDERLRVEQIPGFHFETIEGRYNDACTMPLARIRGPLRSLLAAERVVLNFLQHLCGVATLTRRFSKRVEGTKARIYDTRKTLPGFRALDKYAVLAGGGLNHRIGLYDAVLVKDNHIAGTTLHDLTNAVTQIVAKSQAENASRVVEIEVDTLEQMAEVLKVDGVNIILLDNMDCPRMKQAVAMRDRAVAGRKLRVELEASGGVTLETVHAIALTGVDRISVGAITHSAPALDIGLDIEG